MKACFIKGNKLYLRGLFKEDLRGNMFHWANDPEVTHYMYMGLRPNNLELMEEEYHQLIHSEKDVVFAIIDKKNDVHIGNAGLYAVNWVARCAEYRIVIGEKKYQNKGYGTEATKLVVRYAFDKLNLNKVFLGVNADNKAAVKAYKKAGFVQEGVLRQEIYRNGKYYDAICMSILRKEFYAK